MPEFRREVSEAQRDPNVALTGSGPKVDGVAPNVGSDRVSPKLQDIRSRLDGLGNAVDQNRWLPSNSDTERRDWIRANSAHIKDAAAYTGLPADMIAGIAWQEVQGDPKWVDDVSDNYRQNQHEVWPEFRWVADKVGLTGEADQTSMGPIAIQIRRSAEVLGYDPENMTQAQRDEVERATQGRFSERICELCWTVVRFTQNCLYQRPPRVPDERSYPSVHHLRGDGLSSSRDDVLRLGAEHRGLAQGFPDPPVQSNRVGIVQPKFRVPVFRDHQSLTNDPEGVGRRETQNSVQRHDPEPDGVHADDAHQAVQLPCHDLGRTYLRP